MNTEEDNYYNEMLKALRQLPTINQKLTLVATAFFQANDVYFKELKKELDNYIDSALAEKNSYSPFMLEYIKSEINKVWKKELDIADAYDDEGSHVGFATYHRAKAAGLADALALFKGKK